MPFNNNRKGHNAKPNRIKRTDSGDRFSANRGKSERQNRERNPWDSRSSGNAGDDSPRRSFGKSREAGKGSRKFGNTNYNEHTGRRMRDSEREEGGRWKRNVEDRRNTGRQGREKRVEHVDRRNEVEDKIRLNRYIANSGVCSRRKADELIEAGVVSVNGEVVTTLGTKVDPTKDEIRYNGERLKREKMVYVLLNKPKDYITTTDDPQERRTVMELVEKASRERIYPVGRLDRNTTGLLLLTNDGNLADKLSHPKNNITKIYHVELNKNLTQGDFNKIEFGLELEDGLIKPDSISYVQGASKREIGIQIHSGKNRIVRRIFEHLGYDVIKLDRSIYANLTKKDLPRGRWRFLEEREVIQLKHFLR